MMTFAFHDNKVFVGMLGTLSAMIEAMMAFPQFHLNYK